MLKMLRDRVLVKPIERLLSSTLIVKNTENFNIGEVVAVGPGRRLDSGYIRPIGVRVGEIVRFGEFKFPIYEEAGIKYTILQDDDIAAVVEREVTTA